MLYQIISQWRIIFTMVVLIALAAFALVKGVSVLATDGARSGQPRQTVQAPAAAAGQRSIVLTPAVEAEAQAVQPTPRPPSGIDYHTVQSGDTLGKIAAQYGITTAALANANGITNPDLIRVGQRLLIPAH